MRILWLLLVVAELQIAAAFTAGRRAWIGSGGTLNLHRLRAAASSEDNEQIEKFQIASSRGSGAVQKQKIQKQSSVWDSFKNAIYGTVDGVGSLSEKLAVGSGDSGVVEGGYSSIERTVLNQNSNLSPGQRLMNEYKARSQATPVETAPSQGQASAFDAFKETVYGGVDAASQVFSNEKDESQELLRSFKPLVQSTLSSSEVQGALPDLQSNNPITRRIAETKIKNWEEKERKRQRALEREEAARKFKASVYQFGDVVVASAETLAAVPEQVAKAADETQVIAKNVKKSVDEIPGKVEQVVTTVTSIPVQVKEKSDQVQDSVKTTVETTKQAIDEVKAIPTKIENSVKDTQQKVNAAVTAVDEAATSVKVLVGIEKPIPKPPKQPPPPPPTPSEVGMKIAGSVVTGVATGTAKLAWWAGKGVATSAWNGVQSAYENAAGKGKAPLEEPRKTTPAKPTSNTKEVDDEVQEALDLAQSALEFADQGSALKTDSKELDIKGSKDKENDQTQ